MRCYKLSFPNIPNVTPSIDLSREDVINLLLASIAFEELGLAHIINSEAEKIQAVLGTLPDTDLGVTSLSELLATNQSVNRTLKTALKTQMLLQFKMEDILNTPVQPRIEVFENTATVTATFEGQTVSDSDNAFYYVNVA